VPLSRIRRIAPNDVSTRSLLQGRNFFGAIARRRDALEWHVACLFFVKDCLNLAGVQIPTHTTGQRTRTWTAKESLVIVMMGIMLDDSRSLAGRKRLCQYHFEHNKRKDKREGMMQQEVGLSHHETSTANCRTLVKLFTTARRISKERHPRLIEHYLYTSLTLRPLP
jgi:hypothetical protein